MTENTMTIFPNFDLEIVQTRNGFLQVKQEEGYQKYKEAKQGESDHREGCDNISTELYVQHSRKSVRCMRQRANMDV
jgi:hypothetical protein